LVFVGHANTQIKENQIKENHVITDATYILFLPPESLIVVFVKKL